jgi:hypothetical protein
MKILKHPLDKILDDIPGGSAESIARNRGITFLAEPFKQPD